MRHWRKPDLPDTVYDLTHAVLQPGIQRRAYPDLDRGRRAGINIYVSAIEVGVRPASILAAPSFPPPAGPAHGLSVKSFRASGQRAPRRCGLVARSADICCACFPLAAPRGERSGTTTLPLRPPRLRSLFCASAFDAHPLDRRSMPADSRSPPPRVITSPFSIRTAYSPIPRSSSPTTDYLTGFLSSFSMP
jgi:hypothetical protein